ncbi:transposase [Roseomonas sp. 18066]|uniref:IS66 family transposase n=1 Tax=Roseomonas sp. 18066 TaxID=2681412 RepID=UPI00135C7B78|nr:transposase [Roseomonas sp. 18066]
MKKGYAWALARDDRPWGGTDPPAEVFRYAPGRGQEHARALLADYRGIVQCDGYAAYKALATGGDVTLAFCWAHVRRGFFDLAKGGAAPIASEALQRIAALYAIEAEIRGRPAKERLTVRASRSAALVHDLFAWFAQQLARLLGRSPTADPAVHDGLFDQTKAHYKADDLFTTGDRLDISEDTFRRIVKELQTFDLSKTSDDIKGLAFERFLGTTFRGELGQFFTPRPVVDFMVSMLDPQEGQLICDPAAGSGGFLIRAFEHVRSQIGAAIQADKDKARADIEALGLDADEEERRIDEAFATLNRQLLPSDDQNKPVDTRVGRLAWNCIFGTDAEPRAARTAKMNMIMHGDGHGGIHYHDGLIDINGIFPGRFDIIITNPPFGSNVGDDQKVGGSDETRVYDNQAYKDRCIARYGAPWEESHKRMLAASTAKTKILDLFEIGKGKSNRATEIVFVERCLNLLKPGGRIGIVLPDGNLNNPSLTWLRRWCEGKAKILAVVSLPEETFRSADATVKASLVFLKCFTEADQTAWDAAWTAAHATHDAAYNAERDKLCADFGPRIVCGDDKDAAKILKALSAIGAKRVPPAWFSANPPPYPKSIGATKLRKVGWDDQAKDRKKATTLKKDYAAAFTDDVTKAADALTRELAVALKGVDEHHNAALWTHVREAFDYPVFVAAPKSVGITSTGETGGNVPTELPALLEAYRRFEVWAEAGAKPTEAPDFSLPSAA